ncbi:hypothetical protein SAMN05421810_11537 [Amycolatopsis arida]|uniref:tRNA_anti-like n=1 Tax=Amycolatopsis arida TaxID=587909 RepID=A0A1I6AWQ5_9PSEU|nr:hypothetical protein [Amycolatopsis arida]TDX85381.1 hypothetical protein CLV69_11540 [Amycolatopsis arida]SFQ73073.1 hypothetical protein SAMN05421810_11537 [Amycolatopsis arida]
MPTTRTRGWRRGTAAVLAALPLVLAGCDEDSAGPETGADVEDVTEDDYFGTNEYVGETVTVSAAVTDVINPRAYVLGGQAYGDESLLVLYAEGNQDVREGTTVRATGTVRQFRHADYVEPYGLVDEGRVAGFADEEFLVADRIQITQS